MKTTNRRYKNKENKKIEKTNQQKQKTNGKNQQKLKTKQAKL